MYNCDGIKYYEGSIYIKNLAFDEGIVFWPNGNIRCKGKFPVNFNINNCLESALKLIEPIEHKIDHFHENGLQHIITSFTEIKNAGIAGYESRYNASEDYKNIMVYNANNEIMYNLSYLYNRWSGSSKYRIYYSSWLGKEYMYESKKIDNGNLVMTVTTNDVSFEYNSSKDTFKKPSQNIV